MDRDAILKCSISRKAIKYFDATRRISNEDFDFLLEIARYSPSSFGLEPWNIVVVQNKELRNEIIPFASGAQNQLRTASHFVIFTVKANLAPDSEYFMHINKDIKRFDDEACSSFLESFSAFQREKLQVYDDRTRLEWAKRQAYIALGNMLLAASEIGIDSCPIEGFFTNQVEALLEQKGILDTNRDRIAVMAAFGYRDESVSTHNKTRRDLSEIAKFVC